MAQTGYKFFDFCAGIGSAHLAFKNLGLECVGYSEIDISAEATYRLFHGRDYHNYGDLMQIDPHHLPDFDILCAGFPCQTFSIVGKRQGFSDERGQIIYGLSHILSIKRPKVFLLENVKGLVNINKGETLKNIVKLLSDVGYHVTYKILESTDFGIPQMRERIYFVGIRNDIYTQDFIFPQAQTFPYDLKNFLTEEDDIFIIYQNNNVYATFLRYLKNKYNNGQYDLEDLLSQNYLVLDTRQSDLRLYHNKVPTLRTGRQGILYIKNNMLRKISGREALLLQGFDDGRALQAQEVFPQTKILSQAGNAMTVHVMQAIGEKIMTYLG